MQKVIDSMLLIEYSNSFQRRLKIIFKKYPRAQNSISLQIDNLTKNPLQGDSYPGFGELEVRKIRISIPEYKIGKSKGLWLIFLNLKDKQKIIPLAVYQKNSIAAENEIRNQIVESLKEHQREFAMKKD